MRNNNNDNNERPMRPRMAANSGPVRPAMPLLRSSLLRLAASSRQLFTRISLALHAISLISPVRCRV